MHENLHELSYLTDAEWKAKSFFYRVIYPERWIGEGRHDSLNGRSVGFYDAGESYRVCDSDALRVGHTLSRGE